MSVGKLHKDEDLISKWWEVLPYFAVHSQYPPYLAGSRIYTYYGVHYVTDADTQQKAIWSSCFTIQNQLASLKEGSSG